MYKELKLTILIIGLFLWFFPSIAYADNSENLGYVFEISDTSITTGQAIMILIESLTVPVEIEIDKNIKINDIKPLPRIVMDSADYCPYPNFTVNFTFYSNKPQYKYWISPSLKDYNLDAQYVLLTPSIPGKYNLKFTAGNTIKNYELIVRKGKGNYILNHQSYQLFGGIFLNRESFETFFQNDESNITIEDAKNLRVRCLEMYSHKVGLDELIAPSLWSTYNPEVIFKSDISNVPSKSKIITKLDKNEQGLLTVDVPFSKIKYCEQITLSVNSNLYYSPDYCFGFIYGFVHPDINTVFTNFPVDKNKTSAQDIKIEKLKNIIFYKMLTIDKYLLTLWGGLLFLLFLFIFLKRRKTRRECQ